MDTEPAVPMNLILLAMVRKPLENTLLSNHPCTSELLWYFWFPVEKSQHIIGTKKKKRMSLVALERVKRKSLTLPALPLLQGGTIQCQMRSQHMTSPGG